MSNTINTSYYNSSYAVPDSQKSANTDTGISVNDFLALIAMQLANQDMMNPVSDTEFMAQLAQFTQLEATQNMSETMTASYTASMVGKTITTAILNSKGELEEHTGVVTGVSLYGEAPMVFIGNDGYFLHEIMLVGDVPTIDELGTDDTTTDEGTTSTESVDGDSANTDENQ